MTDVSFKRDGNIIQFDLVGHSDYAPPGKEDIVCAGVSVLIYCFAEELRCLEYKKKAKVIEDVLYPGNTHIKAQVDESADVLIETIKNGFMMLSNSYPNNVSYIDQR